MNLPPPTEPDHLDLIESIIITRGPLNTDDIVEILALETFADSVRPCMTDIDALDWKVRKATYFMWGQGRIHINDDMQWDVPRQR